MMHSSRRTFVPPQKDHPFHIGVLVGILTFSAKLGYLIITQCSQDDPLPDGQFSGKFFDVENFVLWEM